MQPVVRAYYGGDYRQSANDHIMPDAEEVRQSLPLAHANVAGYGKTPKISTSTDTEETDRFWSCFGEMLLS